MSKISRVDSAFRSYNPLKMFTKSFGNPKVLKRIYRYRKDYMSKGAIAELIERKPPTIEVIETSRYDRYIRQKQLYTVFDQKTKVIEGRFRSPLAEYCPEVFPSDNVGISRWRGYFPDDTSKQNGLVILLGGTGDHFYFPRWFFLVRGLLKHGISSIVLETPFYAQRKPPNQIRSSLENVSDLYIMGASVMSECCVLLKWASSKGFFPLGLSGVSLGGYMANLSATNWNGPLSLVPCLSSTTAAPNYTKGAISEAIRWEELEKDIESKEFWDYIKEISDCDWYDRYNMAISSPERRFTEGKFTRSKELMWILMEEFTNLKMYPLPRATHLVKAINAENDGYILKDEIPDFPDIWPGAQVQVIPNCGHVAAYLNRNEVYLKGIVNTMEVLNDSDVDDSSDSNVDSLNVNVISVRS